MPSVSKSQQRAAAMAEHMKPGEMANAGPAVKEMASSMTKGQMHDFASGPMKGKPMHKHKHHKPHMHMGRGSDNEMGRRRNPRGGSN